MNYLDLTLEEQRIRRMNRTFDLPLPEELTPVSDLRILQFESVMHEELCELSKVRQIQDDKGRMVAFADLLGDLLVYTYSEAARHGIPLSLVFHAILDSQDSKLVDGKPIHSADGSKFLKGPNYHPPEEAIGRILYPDDGC